MINTFVETKRCFSEFDSTDSLVANSTLNSLSDSMFNGFVGRIPIYDRKLDLFGYDLKVCSNEYLSRSGSSSRTEEKLDNAVIRASEEIVLPDLVGERRGFLRIEDSLLTHACDLSWPSEQVVLSISDNGRSEDRDACMKDLIDQGYKIAIDGDLHVSNTFQETSFASYCSINVTEGLPTTESFVSSLHDSGVKLFARNIESADQFECVEDLGFDLFQGEYFERPKLVKNTFLSANKLAVLELLARLQDPKVTIQEVEGLISKDITLSYKVLRLINTAFYGMPKKVDSIRRAVVFFGLNRVKNWASVILFNAVEYKPRELMTTALVRARTCENLAEKLGRYGTESYFICGLFSTLDAIMDVPMQTILEQLKLSKDITAALLEGSGPMGELLTSILAIENGVYYRSVSKLLDDGLAMEAYTEAIAWANTVSRIVTD